MARETWVIDPETGDLIPKAEYRRKEPAGNAPALHRDDMAPMKSMLDGQIYESKSAYQRSINEHNARTGADVRIVGNDWTRPSPQDFGSLAPARIRDDIVREVAERLS
jgi:hypothetical protein